MKKRLLTILSLCVFGLSLYGASPWDSWRHGYIAYEQGEQLLEKGNYTEALEQFQNSRKHYLAVRSARPDWNQRVIAERIADCDTKIREIGGRLQSKRTAGKTLRRTAAKSAGKTPSASSGEVSEKRMDDGETSKLRQQLILMEAELGVYKKRVAKQDDFEKEIAGLVRDQRIAAERYALLEQRYKKLQAESSAPGKEFADAKNRLIEEKMRSDAAERRLAVAEQRLRESQEENKNNQLARNAEIKLRQKAEAEILRLQKQNKNLSSAAVQGDAEGKPSRMPAPDGKDNPNDETAASLNDSLQKLKNSTAKLDEENRRLRREIEAVANDAKLSKAESTRFRERNQVLENDVKKLAERCETLTKRVATRESEEFKNAAAAKEERSKLEQQLLNLQNEIVKYRADSDSKSETDKELRRKVKAFDAEVLALRSKLAAEQKKAKKNAEEISKLRETGSAYEELQRNFNALAAENRENKALAAAAKPREAELEKVKLRLLESDRLRTELTREQRLNEELKKEHLKNSAELRALRGQLKELDVLRRRNAELEPALNEVERLKKIQSAYQALQGHEAELSVLKIKVTELENKLRAAGENLKTASAENESLKKRNALLENDTAALSRQRDINRELQTMIKSQTAEIDRLNAAAGKVKKETQDNESSQSQSADQTAAKISTLHNQINQLQDELSRVNQQLKNNLALFRRQLDAAEKNTKHTETLLHLKESEVANLQKLNRDLADYRNNSAEKLQRQAEDSMRIRLEEEVSALTKLNAKLSADRDMLQRQLEAARGGVDMAQVSPQKGSPEELASSGVVAERNGNTELALWNYRQALETDPNFAPAHQRIGIILSSRGDYKAALPHLSAAYAASTDNMDLALMTMRCQIALGRFGSAKAILDPLQKKHPNSWQVQLYSGLIEAGSGRAASAEEKIMMASRLKPDSVEIQIEMARLLAHSITDRSGEAVLAYEKARLLGAAPDPELEKTLGSLLNHRRELVRFLSGAAGEAEIGSDWGAAVWYYRKLIEMKRLEFVPRMALAQFRQGKVSAARETLEFNAPSRLGMAVLSLIDLESGNMEGALRNAGQAAGARLPEDWVGMKLELEKLSKGRKSPAAKALLAAFQR